MRVTDVIAGQRRQPNQVLRLAAAVESGSEHPIDADLLGDRGSRAGVVAGDHGYL